MPGDGQAGGSYFGDVETRSGSPREACEMTVIAFADDIHVETKAMYVGLF